jgi:hypothetical protein
MKSDEEREGMGCIREGKKKLLTAKVAEKERKEREQISCSRRFFTLFGMTGGDRRR